MLQEGTKAPDFSLQDQDGQTVSLRQFAGSKVVLYFYPKDDTPGCTKEACSFRDHHPKIQENGAVVLGVSADSPDSHSKFRQKYSLPFHLLSDPNAEVIKKYGAWGEKKTSGKSYEGTQRSTFIIDENGHIAKVFPNVKPDQHGKEVLEYL